MKPINRACFTTAAALVNQPVEAQRDQTLSRMRHAGSGSK
jgi:hypothetical protein